MRDPLFQPIKINAMEVKNRICMPAMHTNMCNDYAVTEQLHAEAKTLAICGFGVGLSWVSGLLKRRER